MDKTALTNFLIEARKNTYASAGGKVKPVFPGLEQLEYKKDKWLYRDIFNIGNGIFMGLETVYFENKPVLSVSYYGNFKSITEEETDNILRKALMENSDTVRLWNNVEWSLDNYKYTCTIDAPGSIDEFAGSESITKDGKQVYFFYYAGGFIG